MNVNTKYNILDCLKGIGATGQYKILSALKMKSFNVTLNRREEVEVDRNLNMDGNRQKISPKTVVSANKDTTCRRKRALFDNAKHQ